MAETDEHGGALENYFARARSIVLLTAQLAGVRERARRARHPRRRRCAARAATSPRSRTSSATSSSCTRRASARRASSTPTARSSRASCAARSRRPPTCRPTEEQTPFFAPTFALRLRAGAPDPAVRLAGHQGVGRRQRDADPAGRRPQARVRALRGHGRELPPRDGRAATGPSCASSTATPAGSSSTASTRSASARRSACPHDRRFAELARTRRRAPASPRWTDAARAYRRIARDRRQRQRLDRRRQRQGADRRLPLGHRARCRSRCSPSRW